MSNAATLEKPQADAAASSYVGVIPYLALGDANGAGEFYQRAFGAEELARMAIPNETRLGHLHLRINGGSLCISDVFPEYGKPLEAPQGYSLLLNVAEADAWWTRAVDAGCEIVMPLERMFWGDRYGQLRDPYGVIWAINEPA